MNAYVVVDIDIHDPETYAEYRKLAPPSIAAYGGRYLSRAGRTEVLEGEWVPKRLVILEFPSYDQAKAWIDSPEYARARGMRQNSARTNMVVIEGTASPV